MKTNSIFFKIRIAFGLSVSLILGVFVMLYFMQKHFHGMELKERVMHASKASKHLSSEPKLLSERLASMELSAVDEQTADKIFGREIQCDMTGAERFRVIEIKRELKSYIAFCHPRGMDIFEDQKKYPPIPLFLFAAFGSILAALALFYRSILTGLAPLSELKNRVENFAKNGEIPSRTEPFCDEIEAVSKAFDETATYLLDISKARALFLRNIAHELKTPLSRGRFLSEMVENEELRDRFCGLFIHFDSLVNELLQVERLSARGLLLDKKVRLLQDCIDEAIEGGFLDEGSVEIGESNMLIYVDFRLFALALKNLLVNGVKYSLDTKVSIKINDNLLEISNIAPALKRPIEQLLEPFVKGDESDNGLGLGLYIVKQILEAHGARLEYAYRDGRHIFAIPLAALTSKE